MSLLETIVNSPLAGVTGWVLLHSLWEGAIISAVLAAGLLVIRSPRGRYAAGCAAMLLLVIGLCITLTRLLEGGLDSTAIANRLPSSAWSVVTVAAGPESWAPSLAVLAPWLAPFWMAGVLIFSLRHIAGFASLRRLRQLGVGCVPEIWQRELRQLSARLSLSRPVSLLESCLADSPMVLGHFRPLILLPMGMLAGFSAAQIEAILIHELAHIRRHDYLVNLLQRLLEALLFYHPAVWWISRVMRTEREKCCDDAVISISGHAHEYARALATLEENRGSGREPAVGATGGSLMKRIRRLLYPEGPNSPWTPFLAVVILVAAAAVAAAAWQSEPSQSSSPSTQKQENTTRYSKWLNEEVVYIINDGERAAFQKLTTNEERDRFIEQFWERRNPAPGATENAFKEEHYRRIGYANMHFATAAGMPGWQTDRGHMYIVNGPPDEIDAHPKDATHAIGTEQWLYLHAEGIGNDGYVMFVDRNGGGDYHLAPGK